MRLNRPAASIARVLRAPGSVSTHSWPPGLYWYQIGTISGARSGRSTTDSAPMWGSARNRSRSSTESTMPRTVAPGSVKNSRVPCVERGYRPSCSGQETMTAGTAPARREIEMTQYLLSVHMVEGAPEITPEQAEKMYRDVDVFNAEVQA